MDTCAYTSCYIAGAELTINHAGTLSLARVRTLLHNHLQGSDMKDIRGHVAKMSDQLYHVYFIAANPDGDYKEASESFKTKFNEGKFYSFSIHFPAML